MILQEYAFETGEHVAREFESKVTKKIQDINRQMVVRRTLKSEGGFSFFSSAEA